MAEAGHRAAEQEGCEVPRLARSREVPADGLDADNALLLARLESTDPKLGRLSDTRVELAMHDGSCHIHPAASRTPGTTHLGVYLAGDYCPDHDTEGLVAVDHGHEGNDEAGHVGCDDTCRPERFTRVLSASLAAARRSR